MTNEKEHSREEILTLLAVYSVKVSSTGVKWPIKNIFYSFDWLYIDITYRIESACNKGRSSNNVYR